MQPELIKLLESVWPEYEIGSKLSEEAGAEIFDAVRKGPAQTEGGASAVRVVTIPSEKADRAALAARFGGEEAMLTAMEKTVSDYMQQLARQKQTGMPNGAAIKDYRCFTSKDPKSWVICVLTEQPKKNEKPQAAFDGDRTIALAGYGKNAREAAPYAAAGAGMAADAAGRDARTAWRDASRTTVLSDDNGYAGGMNAAPPPPMYAAPPQPPAGPENEEKPRRSGGALKVITIILAILLVLALLAIGGIFAYRAFFDNDDEDDDDRETTTHHAQGDNTATHDQQAVTPTPAAPDDATPTPDGSGHNYNTDYPSDEPATTAPPTEIPATPTPQPAQTYQQSVYYNWGFDVGQDHVLGLQSNGRVAAQGNNSNGKCNVNGWTDIIQVAASYHMSFGLRSDGTVVTAGSDPEYIDVSYIYSWRNIIQISAQARTLIALDRDGNVFVAGHPEKHDPSEEMIEFTFSSSITSYSGAHAVSVSAGRDHVLILFADGTCAAFGREAGKAGERCDVFGWTDIISIAACQGGSVGLKSDGTVVYNGGFRHEQTNVRNLTNIAFIASKGYHFIYIDRNGYVGCTGDNSYGQCNVGQWNNYGGKRVVSVTGSLWVSAALFSDGTVEFIGNQNTINSFGGARNWRNIVRTR